MAAVPFRKRDAANVEEPSTHRKEKRNTPTVITHIHTVFFILSISTNFNVTEVRKELPGTCIYIHVCVCACVCVCVCVYRRGF